MGEKLLFRFFYLKLSRVVHVVKISGKYVLHCAEREEKKENLQFNLFLNSEL